MSIDARLILSVSQLNAAVKQTLAASFSLTWITGEISNLASAGSGHLYFSLKDPAAQVRCAMFRMQRRHLDFTPKNGLQVTVRARVTLYEARGDFQLVVEHMAAVGDGLLQKQFAQLKQALFAEGLFDEARKQSIPVVPKRIGLITSPHGAAIRDALSILKRRFAVCPVVIYPSLVQGAEAPKALAKALHVANQRQDCDVLLLLRGGGSLEDLWAFNTEGVVRAIAATQIPIITGIGHETDTTLADFVADLRASTPSSAAAAASPEGDVWLRQFGQLRHRLTHNMEQRLQALAQKLDWLQRHLQQLHPGHKIQLAKHRLMNLSQRLHTQWQVDCQRHQTRITLLRQRLNNQSPETMIQRYHIVLVKRQNSLEHAMQAQLKQAQFQLSQAATKLDAFSPLATLNRGYTLVTESSHGRLRTHAADCQPGEHIQIRFVDGVVNSTIDKT